MKAEDIDLTKLVIEDGDLLILRVVEELRPSLREVYLEGARDLKQIILHDLGKNVVVVLLEPGHELTRIPQSDGADLVARVRDEVLRALKEQANAAAST